MSPHAGLTLENYLSPDLENVTLEVLKGVVVALLPCESAGMNHFNDQEQRHRAQNITRSQLLDCIDTPVNIQETSDRISDDEESGFQKLLGCHDLSLSLQRAQESLQDLAASIHVGGKGVGAHTCEAAEVGVCSVVVESGGSLTLPTGAFHSITTTSSSPAVYSYSFTNATLSVEEQRSYMSRHHSGRDGQGVTHTTPSDGLNSNTHDGQSSLRPDLDNLNVEFPSFQDLIKFIKRKLTLFWRSGRLLVKVCHCIVTNSCPKRE